MHFNEINIRAVWHYYGEKIALYFKFLSFFVQTLQGFMWWAMFTQILDEIFLQIEWVAGFKLTRLLFSITVIIF